MTSSTQNSGDPQKVLPFYKVSNNSLLFYCKISLKSEFLFIELDFDILISQIRKFLGDIDPFPKRRRLVHNGGFPKFEELYCSLNMVSSTEIS